MGGADFTAGAGVFDDTDSAFCADGFYDDDAGSRNILSSMEKKIFTYEMNRIGQALREAGISPSMLNSMQRAQVIRSLMMDSTLFEEGGAMYKLFRQMHGLRDAVHLTATEKEANTPHFVELTEAKKQALEEDWAVRRKNLASFLYVAGNCDSPEKIETEAAAYRRATPDYPGTVNLSYHLARPVPLSMLSLSGAVQESLQGALEGLLQSFSSQLGGIQVEQSDNCWVKLARGSWVDEIGKNAGKVKHSQPEEIYSLS